VPEAFIRAAPAYTLSRTAARSRSYVCTHSRLAASAKVAVRPATLHNEVIRRHRARRRLARGTTAASSLPRRPHAPLSPGQTYLPLPWQARVQVGLPWWRCRESNPGPPSPRQGFSVRSPLCLYSDPPVARTSRCDNPSRCECPIQTPRPGLLVSPLADAGNPGRGRTRSDRSAPGLGGEGEIALIRIGAYWCAMTLAVVSRLHRHASH
jgi:hypothetical protein